MKGIQALIIVAFTLLCLASPPAECSTISSITIELFPTKGDISTDLTVKVRGVPFAGGFLTVAGAREYPVLYLYYDDKVLVSRVAPITSSRGYGDFSDYSASWDVNVKVPNEYPYSELGQHVVKVRVEASDGTSASASANFNVVNYIQPPEWWRDLPSEFLAMIQGPAGPKGATGAQGLKGDPGVSAPMEYIYASMGVSIIAIIIALIAVTRRRY